MSAKQKKTAPTTHDYYTKIPDVLIRSPFVGSEELKLYALLASRSPKKVGVPQRCIVPKKLLMASLQLGRTAVNSAINGLKELGLLAVTYNNGGYPVFQVLEPPDDICPPEFLSPTWNDLLRNFDTYDPRKRRTRRSSEPANRSSTVSKNHATPDEEVDHTSRMNSTTAPSFGFHVNRDESMASLAVQTAPPVVQTTAGIVQTHSSHRPDVRPPSVWTMPVRDEEDITKYFDEASIEARVFADAKTSHGGLTHTLESERAARATNAQEARTQEAGEERKRQEKKKERKSKKKKERRKSQIQDFKTYKTQSQPGIEDVQRAGGTKVRLGQTGRSSGEGSVAESAEQKKERLDRNRQRQLGLGSDGKPLDVSASTDTSKTYQSVKDTKDVSDEDKPERWGKRRVSHAQARQEAANALEKAIAEAAEDSKSAAEEGKLQTVPQEPLKLYAYLRQAVQAKFPKHALPVPNKKFLAICGNLIRQYSPEELFEMIRVMVLDWDCITYGSVFMSHKGDTVPSLMFFAANAERLHTRIGHGFAEGGGQRYSAYAADYRKRKEPESAKTKTFESPLKVYTDPKLEAALAELHRRVANKQQPG